MQLRYLDAYKTTDRFDFYRAIEILEVNQIDFQLLHEYRLHAEFNFESEGDPAILRVHEADFIKANNLLIEAGLLNVESGISHSGSLNSQSSLDENLHRIEINELLGSKIKRVLYVLANDPHFDFEKFHSIDYAIVLEFESGKYLSWKFEEEDGDFENETFIPQRYDLQFSNILTGLDKSFKIKDVSSHHPWVGFMKEKISKIELYTQETSDASIITDLILLTNSSRIAIFSTNEPDEREETKDVNFSIGNELTVVVFDEEVIIKRRIN